MLTVVDRPVIQHVVDEAREAGIEHFIFVTGRNKGVIEDHFDIQFELEATLRAARQDRRAGELAEGPARARPDRASPASRSRSASATPSGARATSSATSPSRCCCPTCCFAANAGLPEADDRGLRGDRRQHHRGRGSRSDQDVSAELRHRRRSARAPATAFASPAWWRSPGAGHRPLNLFISGRYILQPEIFDLLGASNRVLEKLSGPTLTSGSPEADVHWRQVEGRLFDCGSKIGFLTANVAFALARDDIAPEFRAALNDLIKVE